MVISKLGVTEGDGRLPKLDKWAVKWAVIMETWARNGGVLEGRKGVGMVTSCPPKVFSEFGKWKKGICYSLQLGKPPKYA